MSAEIIYEGQGYWTIVRRFNLHRSNKTIKPLAIFEMRRLNTKSEAVKRRVQSFLSMHHNDPPSSSPNGGGPRVA